MITTTAGALSTVLVSSPIGLRTGAEAGLPAFMSSSVTPPGRSTPTVVYSRAAGGLFLLGGLNAALSPMTDVWFLPLGGAWGQLTATGMSVSRVLAATYSFADKRLWVAAIAGTQALLLHVNPNTGAVTLAGKWPYTGTYIRHEFSVDRDGKVILFAVTSSGTSKVAVLNHTGSTVVATRIDRDQAALSMAPIVDENGYTYVRTNDSSTRTTTLGGVSGSFSLSEIF